MLHCGNFPPTAVAVLFTWRPAGYVAVQHDMRRALAGWSCLARCERQVYDCRLLDPEAFTQGFGS